MASASSAPPTPTSAAAAAAADQQRHDNPINLKGASPAHAPCPGCRLVRVAQGALSDHRGLPPAPQ